MNKLLNSAKRHKYIIIFIILSISFVQYFMHYYPGIIISDTYSQIKQALGLRSIDNHHPVFQTLIWYIFIHIGKIFKNDNIIVAANSIFQIICTSAVFTYSIYYLDKNKIKNKLLILFYAIYPVYGIFSIYTTKDVMFSICISFYIIELSKLIKNPNKILKNKKNIFLFLLSNILVILYKNNGIYIIIITNLFLMIYIKKYIKKIVSIFIILLFFYILLNNIIFGIFNIKPTQEVEKLGVPLEQINYLVYTKYDRLDKNILDKINKYISVEDLRNIYNEEKIDPIKKYFNEEYYKNNKLEFFKLSFQLFRDYPQETIYSFYIKNRVFFVPNRIKPISIYIKPNIPINVNMSPIIYNPIIDFIEHNVLKYSKASIISRMLISPAINFYAIIILFIYALIRKKEWILIVPILVVWLTTFVAPGSVYRYVFSSIVCLPYLLFYICSRTVS